MTTCGFVIDPEELGMIRNETEESVPYCDRNRHLVCYPYSIENLHAVAQRLGLKRCWFHGGKGHIAHYDIPKRRESEIMSKCFIVTSREIAEIGRGKSRG